MQSKKAASKSTQRVIKKYPNRRLYDTDSSAYITLTEVKQLVMDGTPFVVRDAKSAEDLTRSILLQILLEEEAGGAPIFTEQALAGIIRFYGHAMQGFMGPYLERSIQAMAEVQQQMAHGSQTLSPETWAQFMTLQPAGMQGAVGSYVEQSQALFTQLQEQMKKNADQMLGAFGVKRP